MSDSSASSGAGGTHSERRRVPRYSLIATAEIIEPSSGVHLSGRVSEIGHSGCYFDVLNVLPPKTRLRIRISRDQGSFVSEAQVIYAQEGMGMGLVFVNTAPDQIAILDSWLAELHS